MDRLTTFAEFWPFYLEQHRDPTNRRLHFVGSTLALGCVVAALLVTPIAWAFAPLCGYGFAWVGHFFFEKNRPATFTYPLWSLMGDAKMYALTWRGKMPR
jgi:hypothetical protein